MKFENFILNKHFIVLFFVTIVLIVCFKTIKFINQETRERTPLEFAFTPQEQAELNELRKLSINDELIEASMRANRAALFIVGQELMTYKSEADMGFEFISKSAALGFAPAIHILAVTAVAEDIRLLQVYLKLLLELGHQEFLPEYSALAAHNAQYYSSQDRARINTFIAQKKSLILENKRAFMQANDKHVFFVKLMGITTGDTDFIAEHEQMVSS